MIWDEFCDVNISVFIAYFAHFQNDKNRNTEIDKISNDVEIHDSSIL